MRLKGKVRAVGYIRISTNEDKQKYGMRVQSQAIKEYCQKQGLELLRIYRDMKSGSSLQRPGIQSLLKEKDKFQVLVVYKIDRLSRSLLDLLKLIKEELAGKDIVFLEEGIDQRTKEGRLLLNQLASFAEYERELIISRIKDGLAEARRNGVKLGAKPRFQEYSGQVRKLKAKGYGWNEICEKLNINFRTAKKAYFCDCT